MLPLHLMYDISDGWVATMHGAHSAVHELSNLCT